MRPVPIDPDPTVILERIEREGLTEQHPLSATIRPDDLESLEPDRRRLQPGELPVLVGEGAGTDTDPIVLGDLLGKGAAGFVQAGWQTALEREVAVKRIRKRPPPRKEVEALLVEARVTGALEHPNIIPVHSLGRAKAGEPLLVMKKVEGTTWKDLIRDPGHENWSTWRGDPLDRHLGILIQVCRGLEFAHSRGWLHLDIKPHNIMVGSFGETWVMDWGLATQIETLDSLPKEEIVGTPAYMAPELLRGRRYASPRSDVFLVGAVLYEVLTGHALYRGDSLSRVLMAAMQCRPPSFPADAPSGLVQIVRTACAKDPEDRYAGPRQLREAVEDWLERRGAQALADAAEAQARRLRELLPDPWSRAAPEVADQVSSLATSSRFGFEQALLQWPGNDGARAGLQRLLEHAVAFELTRNNVEAAQAHLEGLPEPRAKLAAKLKAAREALEVQLDARERIREIEAEQTFATIDWRRSIGMMVNGTFWAAAILGWGWAIEAGHVPDPTRFNLAVAVVGTVISVSVVFFLRTLFMDNAVRRGFTAAYGVFILGLDLNRVAATFLDMSLQDTFVADHTGLIMFIGALAAFVAPTLWLATGVVGVGMVMTVLFPSMMFPIAALELFLVNAIVGWALRPPSAGGRFA